MLARLPILTKLPHYPSLSLSDMVGHHSATELSMSQVEGPVKLGVRWQEADWHRESPPGHLAQRPPCDEWNCYFWSLYKPVCKTLGSGSQSACLTLAVLGSRLLCGFPVAPLWPSLILPVCTLVSCSARPPYSSPPQLTIADPSQPSSSDSGKLHLWAGKLGYSQWFALTNSYHYSSSIKWVNEG